MRALLVIFSALLWVFTTGGVADAQTAVKYLDWPGKTQPKTVAAPQAAPAPVAQPAFVPPSAMAVTPPPQTFAQAFAPKSIYDAPPPLPATAASAATPAVAVVAAASSQQPRRYSLHRDYGEQPDHAVIPAPVYLDHLPVDKAEKVSKEAKHDADASDDDSDGGAA